MRGVPPSVLVREKLDGLLSEGVDREANIVSARVETVTRLVVQELLEGEQADVLGGGCRCERRREGRGLRNGYERGHIRTAEGERDHRTAVGGLRGLLRPGPLQDRGRVPVRSQRLEA
jgi:hypothetical protein